MTIGRQPLVKTPSTWAGRLRKRCLIETLNDNFKTVSQFEPSRHRSLTGFMVHLVGGLIAYTYQPKKPSLACDAPNRGCQR